jgi:hypothetical protein
MIALAQPAAIAEITSAVGAVVTAAATRREHLAPCTVTVAEAADFGEEALWHERKATLQFGGVLGFAAVGD